MSIEITIIVTIISASIALAGLILNGQSNIRKEIGGMRKEINDLRERMARLEGLMEGLREAITGRRVVDEPGQYSTD